MSFAHNDPSNARRFARRVGPYAQDRAGVWFTFSREARIWRAVSSSSKGVQSYLRTYARRRLMEREVRL